MFRSLKKTLFQGQDEIYCEGDDYSIEITIVTAFMHILE